MFRIQNCNKRDESQREITLTEIFKIKVKELRWIVICNEWKSLDRKIPMSFKKL